MWTLGDDPNFLNPLYWKLGIVVYESDTQGGGRLRFWPLDRNILTNASMEVVSIRRNSPIGG